MKNLFIIAGITIVVMFVVSGFLQRFISDPITHLVNIAKEISTGNYSVRASINTNDELKQLEKAFNNMVTDIVEAKERAETSANFKAKFLANMSHEIRTPMNGVVGMIDLLEKKTKPNHLQMEYIQTIKSSSRSLLAIINDILNLSKLEAGKMDLVESNANIYEIINQMISLFASKAIKKKIYLDFEIDPSVPKFIKTDVTRLQQVISNLLSNALKFTEAGSVSINVELLGKKGSDTTLKFSVIDTGTGMKEDDISKLFTAFNQLDSSSTKRFEGTGLGLSISKQIVQLMGGEIGVESTYGKGTTFWFTIHVQLGEKETIPVIQESENQQEQVYDLNILLVDDNKVNLTVATTMLMELGCRVTKAMNGLEAIDLYSKDTFDIVFMDIRMPLCDGVEATQRIKSAHKSTAPIIGLSANAMQGDAEFYMSNGLDDYLSKPVTFDKFIYIFNKWIYKKSNSGSDANEKQAPEPDDSKMTANEVVIADKVIEGLKKMLSKQPNGVESFLNLFLEDAKELMDKLKVASESRDVEQMCLHLHTLEGLADTVGARQFHDEAVDIHKKVKQGDLSSLDNDISGLFENYRTTIDVVKEKLEA